MPSPLPIGKVPPHLLERLVYRRLGARRNDVRLHAQLGEDCAAIEFGDEVAVLTTDPITGAGPDLGWYAVFVATNDLAAAGAEPVALALTLLLAPDDAAGDLERIMRDAGSAAAELGVEIVGGHSEVTAGIARTILVATALGRAPKDGLLHSGAARPGDALLLTKGAGIEGTPILASALRARLLPRLGAAALARAEAYRGRISVLPEARAAARHGARAMHDVTEGGVLGAVYEMAEAARTGIRVEAGKIPVPAETAAICAHLGLDPLRLIGSGALLIATPDPARTAAGVAAAGVAAAETGRFADAGAGRVVTRDGVPAPLPPPGGDELWRALAASQAGAAPEEPGGAGTPDVPGAGGAGPGPT